MKRLTMYTNAVEVVKCSQIYLNSGEWLPGGEGGIIWVVLGT